MWKQFSPHDVGVIIDQLVIPSMVDFDSLLIGIDSLQPYYIEQQATRLYPSPFYEKTYITKDMLRQSLDATDPFTGHVKQTTPPDSLYHYYSQEPPKPQ